MRRRMWIVIGSLTGLVACSALVMLAAVLVHDLRGPILRYQGVPALVISGAFGIALGALVTSRVALVTPRRTALLGAVAGAVLGAAAMGSLFLAVEVSGPDWPQGLSAFVTGAVTGGVLGGMLGGVVGAHAGRRANASPVSRSAVTSFRDAR